jgi:hypothetical protein
MVKKNFVKPDFEIIKFEAEDIICTSGGGCVWDCSDCQCEVDGA